MEAPIFVGRLLRRVLRQSDEIGFSRHFRVPNVFSCCYRDPLADQNGYDIDIFRGDHSENARFTERCLLLFEK